MDKKTYEYSWSQQRKGCSLSDRWQNGMKDMEMI